MTKPGFILIFAVLVGLAGCRSFSSTALTRMGDNSYVGSSNGNQKLAYQARPFKGVPITLKVPTHLDVYIDETYYLQGESDDAFVTEPIAGTRLLNVRTELIKTKKVFIVDFKRPGSGTLDTDTTFTDEQYFAKISNQLTDTTITDSSKLLQTALTGKSTSGVDGPTAEQRSNMMAKLVRDSRVVAYQRFDINDPDFELQVETFVNQHLNDCDQCGQSPSYDRISQ